MYHKLPASSLCPFVR